MSKISGKKVGEEPEISTASMADIAFLLIVFFMVTTVFSATKGLDFKLPSDDDSNQPAEAEEAISFKVIEDGSFLMDGKPAVREDIMPYIGPKLERWPDKPIIIYTRAQAPYSSMVTVYDELMRTKKKPEQGGLGRTKPPNISIPTYREIQEYERVFGYNPFEQ